MHLCGDVYFYEGDQMDLHSLYQGLGSSNFLLIRGPGQILIDTGVFRGPHWKRIAQELASDGNDISKTRHILISHPHPDHFVGAKDLLRKHQCDLYVHEHAEEFLNDSDYHLSTQYNYPKYIRREITLYPRRLLKILFRFIGFHYDYVRVTHIYPESGKLSLYGHEFEIIPTFGHHSGHVAFWLPQSRVLYTGDVFGLQPYPCLSCNTADADYETGLSDLKTLLKLEPEFLVQGHEKLIRGREKIRETLKMVLEKSEGYIHSVRESVTGREKTITEICGELFPLHSFHRINYLSLVYHILKYLRRKGHVTMRLDYKQYYWKALE